MEIIKFEQIEEIKQHALNMRKTALKMAYSCGKSAHIGGGLSEIDALAVLYGKIMNCAEKNTDYYHKDKFILSKGHGALGLYAALFEFGIIPEKMLNTFMEDGSDLIAHPVLKPEWGIEASSGSLGQGISMAVGLALSSKIKGYPYSTYVLCGNGECNEGSVWEACMAAVSYKLDNFTLYIDNNNMQSDGCSSEVMNVSRKYSGMLDKLGFQVVEIDGNDVEQLIDAFSIPHTIDCPKVIIGNTIKGKGIGFMEANNTWHHNRLTKEQFDVAMNELESSND